jgi:alkyl hydroperoxide reductase subunit D
MSLNSVYRRIPSYLSDLKKNFEDLFLNPKNKILTQEQFSSVALAICYSVKNELLINNFKYEARLYLEESHITNIRASVIMVVRNNVFYNFASSAKDDAIRQADIDLEEQALSHANIDHITLMMCMLAVSTVNGSDACMKFYTEKLLARAVTHDIILAIARLASVLKAVSEVLEIEAIRSYEFVPRGENI